MTVYAGTNKPAPLDEYSILKAGVGNVETCAEEVRSPGRLEALSAQIDELKMQVADLTDTLCHKTNDIFGTEPSEIEKGTDANAPSNGATFYLLETSVTNLRYHVECLNREVHRYAESGL